MNVAYTPTCDINPYMNIIYGEMERQGIRVRGFPDSRFRPGEIETGNPEILHFHWIHEFLLRTGKNRFLAVLRTLYKSFLFFRKVRYLKKRNIGIVWSVHDIVSHECRRPRLEKYLYRKFSKYVDRIISLSAVSVNEISQNLAFSEEKISIVPHMHYIDHYPNNINRAEARKNLNISVRDFVFLFFGAIREYKGIDNLIEAFQDVFSGKGDVKLLIAGTVFKSQQEYKCKLLNKISSPGIIPIFETIPEEEVQVYMNAADVLVLPFRKITNSGSTVLGMSFGKAVIAPDHRIIKETLAEQSGLVYDRNHPEGLKNALLYAYNQPENLVQTGKRNFAKAGLMDPGAIAAKTIEIYRQTAFRNRNVFNR